MSIRERGRPRRGTSRGHQPAGWWMILLLLFAWGPARAAQAEYSMGPPPAWVVAVKPGVASAEQLSKSNDGVAYLLLDSQVLADSRQRMTYHRLVSKALNASGVDALANIEISFDPAYQRLVLHSINIVRHGQVIPKLAKAKIRVIQREAELETRIYDGTKSVNVFLDDVRAGDVIEYAYTRIGRNPVFKGSDFGTMALQFGSPIARIYHRLLLPLTGKVAFARRNTSIEPAVREHDGLRDYVWDVTDASALNVEAGAPEWYQPFAEVSWSTYPDWAAVARWAVPLYRVPDTLSPALQSQVKRIAHAESTASGRMLAALRLVQGEVRYLGVEIGQNSHAPNAPSLVFDRRFGDCKDKTLLTLTLLDRLGIDARAALVNTGVRKGLGDVLPNPGAFDHVLVRARVDGKTWWIDPTREVQKADLAHFVQPDYGLALIVDPATQGLTAMPHADPASARRRLNAVYDARAGFEKPVRLTLRTVAEGRAAEALRAGLAASNVSNVQKNYLNFYANSYPHIQVAALLQVQDDTSNNRVTTTETYDIADISAPSSERHGQVAEVDLPDIVDVLRDPPVTVRKAPLKLAYPVDVSQRTEVLLPSTWPVKAHSTTIDNPAFRFEQTVQPHGEQVVITDHFQRLAEEVAAKDMSGYLADLARARAIAGYQFTWSVPVTPNAAPNAAKPSGLDRVNWPLAVLALGLLGFWIWLALRFFRYDPEPRHEADTRWVGLGGWLVLLAFGLLVRPLIYGKTLFTLADAMALDNWSALTTFGNANYSALWAPAMIFEMAADLGLLVFSILLVVLFFKRRSSFPRLAIVVLVAGLAAQIMDVGLSGLLPTLSITPKDMALIVRTAVAVAIWWAYLVQSRRVKATFVRRYRLDMPPPLPPMAAGPAADHAGRPKAVAEPV